MNKKENIKNLVKRMFLSISMMSFFVSAGVDNASAMEQNSIFGEAHKRKSDNSQQNTAPISAPMATLSAKQDNSGYRLAVPDSPTLDPKTGVGGGSLIFEQGLNKDPDNNDKNTIFGKVEDKGESFRSEGYGVRFIFPIPEPSKDVTNTVNDDVAEYLKNIDSVDDIPACMYDHILKALDQQNSDKNITILLLDLYGVNVDGFLDRDKSVSLLAKTLYTTFKKAQENSK